VLLLENSPSKLSASEKSSHHFISAPAETSAESADGYAPLTVKLAPRSTWKTAVAGRSAL
jgi:hypothetical protein